MTCTVVSGWIRNLALYTKDEDFPVGKSVDLNGMTDIKDNRVGWQAAYSSIENILEVIKLEFPGLVEADFEIFEGPSSFILDVKRKDDWYQLAIFKILKAALDYKTSIPTHLTACKDEKGVKVSFEE